MQKRKIIIGTYDTAIAGLWTLTGWEFSDPELKEEYVTVPGHDGDLDFSTVLTDGEPCYGNRSFVATLESSEGDRLEREARIKAMVNELDGYKLHIVLPDDPNHYIVGRVRVARLYNDLAHASVQVSAICEPWKYSATETVVGLEATETEQTATLINAGRRSVIPTVKVIGGSVLLAFENEGEAIISQALSEGTYTLPDLYLRRGSMPLRYSGSGTILLTYREAVLQ